MEIIKPTSDRKVRFYSTQYNTFGLLPGTPSQGGTCPGCTTEAGGCWHLADGRTTHTCYVDKLMRAHKSVRAILQHNTDVLRAATTGDKIRMLRAEFTRFEAAEERRAERLKTKPFVHYRLHWSGDIFDNDYAIALSSAIRQHPNTMFWTYTRSFEQLSYLKGLGNLALYLSLDPVNRDRGIKAFVDNEGEQQGWELCYMSATDDWACGAPDTCADEADPMYYRARIKMHACPVDTGKFPMNEGCSRCRRCINPTQGSVWFKT